MFIFVIIQIVLIFGYYIIVSLHCNFVLLLSYTTRTGFKHVQMSTSREQGEEEEEYTASRKLSLLHHHHHHHHLKHIDQQERERERENNK